MAQAGEANGFWGDVAKWLRRGSAKPLFTGSNPVVASNFFEEVAYEQ